MSRALPLLAFPALLATAATAVQAQPVRPYRPAVDVLAYDFALTLPDTGATLDGVATVRVVRTAPTDTLVLDLLHLRVDEVRVLGAVTLHVTSALSDGWSTVGSQCRARFGQLSPNASQRPAESVPMMRPSVGAPA